MAIEYAFYDRSPETLIEVSEMPDERGIAVALHTTGYEIGTDEVVELTISDLAGDELFRKRVKPQNVEQWSASQASGGISPEDVAEAPELFQFEDEISELFEKASIVVAEHIDFIREMIEASWISLPPFKEFDLASRFCESHCTQDHPEQPAATASLKTIARYYGIAYGDEEAGGDARACALCYRSIVEEHRSERAAKGPEYWEAYERACEEARSRDAQAQEKTRIETVKALRVNAIMWLCAAAIFSNLAVQLHIRGFDVGFVIMAAAAAIFGAVRWIIALYRIFKLRR